MNGTLGFTSMPCPGSWPVSCTRHVVGLWRLHFRKNYSLSITSKEEIPTYELLPWLWVYVYSRNGDKVEDSKSKIWTVPKGDWRSRKQELWKHLSSLSLEKRKDWRLSLKVVTKRKVLSEDLRKHCQLSLDIKKKISYCQKIWEYSIEEKGEI